jgi:hypothetical protein
VGDDEDVELGRFCCCSEGQERHRDRARPKMQSDVLLTLKEIVEEVERRSECQEKDCSSLLVEQ